MTMVEAGIVAEELGAALHPGPWLSSAVAAPRALARLGAGDAGAELLTGIADGTTIAAVGPLERNDAAVTAAERHPDVVLRGEMAISDAAAANVLLVLAGPDGRAFRGEDRRLRYFGDPERGSTRPASGFESGSTTWPRAGWPRRPDAAAVVDDVLIATAADALDARGPSWTGRRICQLKAIRSGHRLVRISTCATCTKPSAGP
jgi:hypothetical protein